MEKVIIGEGSGSFEADKAMSVEDALDKIIAEADALIGAAESAESGIAVETANKVEALTDVLPGFPEKIEGEIIFCPDDNINTDGIYPGKLLSSPYLTTRGG